MTDTSDIKIGLIEREQLPEVLDLYQFLHTQEPTLECTTEIWRLWDDILSNPALKYVGAFAEGQLVSSCALTIIPNLTRAARPYGLIENVVTHPDYRKRGIGTAVLRHALELAWAAHCYKVMLLTGRNDEATLRFYEGAGFVGGVKTGFQAKPAGG